MTSKTICNYFIELNTWGKVGKWRKTELRSRVYETAVQKVMILQPKSIIRADSAQAT